jgi:hypothetical protein
MIERERDLPIYRQAEALGVSRGAVYNKPKPTSAAGWEGRTGFAGACVRGVFRL